MHETFQDAQLDIASGSTCRCGACDRTEDLSLKFVVHAGEFDVQNIGGRKELIGPDIIVATRLLKNSVPVREYVIATPSAAGVAEAAGVPTQIGPRRARVDRADGVLPTSTSARSGTPTAKSKAFHVTPEIPT